MEELYLYGSARLGNIAPDMTLKYTSFTGVYNFITGNYDSVDNVHDSVFDVHYNYKSLTRGYKSYELINHLGNVLAVISDEWKSICADGGIITYEATVVQATDYSAFGAPLPGRTYTATTDKKYRFTFNGKEEISDEQSEESNCDFGDRFYYTREGRYVAVDRFSEKYPYFSPYSFPGNSPICSKDINGDSLYILFYVTGNRDGGDNMFHAAALTRSNDIQRSKTFDPNRDKVVVIEIQDISDIKKKVESTVAENKDKYGATVEVGIWSHAGTDGPRGGVLTKHEPLQKRQMTLKGWSEINFNWSGGGSGCRIGFYGCNSGVDPEGPKASFSTEVSVLSNFKNVTTIGQTTNTYPSIYTDYRDNLDAKDNDFIKGTSPNGYVHFQRTYLVGGYGGWRGRLFFEQNDVAPIRTSRNGRGSVGGTQTGSKKPSDD